MSVLSLLRRAALNFFALVFAVATSLPMAFADSHQFSHSVMVHDAYARATFPQAQTGAVYLKLHNSSGSPRRLMAVSVSKDIASDAQLHTTRIKNDMMQMVQITDGLDIQAGATLTFQPGGHHIMLMGLKQGLTEGETVELTLVFANGEQLTVVADIRLPGDDKETHHHHHD